ncbi:uncharacterized protein VTP21DRAFT_8110 [Calcarisporiella thermophila]|uniref:uncharacterized protein n=1 Tax=Calcarisporiella thermophila TaxID=911321 RepID=UPI003742B434
MPSTSTSQTIIPEKHKHVLTGDIEESITEIGELLAKAFFSGGVPFNFIENDYFQQFLSRVCPSCNVISRYRLANPLLSKTFKEVKQGIDLSIQASENLCLVADSWTNIRGESVMNFVITTPKPFFYDVIFIDTNQHTGEYIAREISKIIRRIGPDKVKAVVTDNAANMKAAWSILEKEFHNLVCYGCASHATNLLLKDVLNLPWAASPIGEVKAIAKWFRKHPRAYSILKKAQREKLGYEIALALPVETRWLSYSKCLESVLSTRVPLQIAALELASSELRCLLQDTWWEKAEELRDIIKPITEVIIDLERDTPRLSLVNQHYFSLMKMAVQLPGNQNKNLIEKIAARFNFIKKPVMTVAHILDPKHSAFSYEIESLQDVQQFLWERHPQDELGDIYTELLLFNSKSPPFDSPVIWDAAKKLDPIVWWKKHTSLSPRLANLAITVLSMPASAAASERNWSNFGFIHNGIRNRLNDSKAFKLVYIYSNLRLQRKIRNSELWFTEEELEEEEKEEEEDF